MPDLTKPLTDSEIDRLDDFLYGVNSDEGMNIEELDGFFCALICSPELVPPSEYMPHLWGGKTAQPAFASAEEAQEILALITRHWNAIAATLLRDKPYTVVVNDCENRDETGQEWALGFVQGMYLREKPWQRLINDEEAGAILFPIMVLVQGEEHGLSDVDPPEDGESALDVLSNAVLHIYRYFRTGVRPPQSTGEKRTAAKKKIARKRH